MVEGLYLPKLNKLCPTLNSTLLKAVEEAGELARAVLKFLPYENLHPSNIAQSQGVGELLQEVSSELLDVAQVCVTMIFVMEDAYGIRVEPLIAAHLAKLKQKGYDFDVAQQYSITTVGQFKYLRLPRLNLTGVTLLTTVCKIQEELGEFTQYLGKRAGASGERTDLDSRTILNQCALELLDVAQCCFTMMYILAGKYSVNIEYLIEGHINKLRSKGYCA